MIEPWHAPILVMAVIIVLEFLLNTERVKNALGRRLNSILPRVRQPAVRVLVLMLITAAVVALFGSNVASTLVGILGGLASVFAFLVYQEQKAAGPGSRPDTDQRETETARIDKG